MSSENRRIARQALDREVPPLKTSHRPKGASNRTPRVATTQMSFSNRNAGCGASAWTARQGLTALFLRKVLELRFSHS